MDGRRDDESRDAFFLENAMSTMIIRFAIAIALAAGAWWSAPEARGARVAPTRTVVVTLQHAELDRDVDPALTATVRTGSATTERRRRHRRCWR